MGFHLACRRLNDYDFQGDEVQGAMVDGYDPEHSCGLWLFLFSMVPEHLKKYCFSDEFQPDIETNVQEYYRSKVPWLPPTDCHIVWAVIRCFQNLPRFVPHPNPVRLRGMDFDNEVVRNTAFQVLLSQYKIVETDFCHQYLNWFCMGRVVE